MGGCASKPKESDTRTAAPESVPTEAPASPKQADPQDPVVAQESENEAPLVDVSEPKEEGEKPVEPKADDAETVPQEVAENLRAKAEEDGEAKVVEETPKEQEGKVEEETKTDAEAKSNEPLVTA